MSATHPAATDGGVTHVVGHQNIELEKPPSTGSAVPVTKLLAGLQRKTAAPARSSGSPQRRAGVRLTTRSCNSGMLRRAPRVRSVLIQPGRMLLTWMLSVAQAEARLRVS